MSYEFVGSEIGSYSLGGISCSINAPPEMQVGDLLVAVILCNDTNPGAPAGWSSLADIADPTDTIALLVYAYTVQESDLSISSYTWSTEAWGIVGSILDYRGPLTSTPSNADVGLANAVSDTNTITIGPVRTTVAQDLVVTAFAAYTGIGSAFSSFLTGETQRIEISEGYELGYNGSTVEYVGTFAVCDTEAVSPGSAGGVSATSSITAEGLAAVTIAFKTQAAPNTPVLGPPANASYDDAAAGITLEGQYGSPAPLNTQTGYICEIKVSGAGSWSYFNASTNALQGTSVTNAYAGGAVGSTFGVVIPGGLLADGNIYNWSLAAVDQGGTSAFAGAFTFTAQAAPALSVTGPTGTITLSTATVTWSATFPSGVAQTAYRAVLYTAAQAGVSGFVPGSGPSVADTGVVTSSSATSTVFSGLANTTTFVAYVQITETGAETSAWASTTFTTAFDPPRTPTIIAVAETDPDTGAPIIAVTVTGADNLLSTDDASFETATGTVTAGTNTTISHSTTWAADGLASLALKATATGSVVATTAKYGCSGLSTFMASFHSTASTLAATLVCSWYQASGAPSAIRASDSISVTANNTGATQALKTVTAPSDATQCALSYEGAGLAESAYLYVDECGVFPGTVTTWTRGGLAGSVVAAITYTDNLNPTPVPLRGGNPITLPTAGQSVTVDDYEAIPGDARTYSVSLSVNFGPTDTITSGTATSNAVTINTTSWWLVYPGSPALNIDANVIVLNGTQIEQSSAQYSLGVSLPVVVADVVNGGAGSVTFQTFSAAAYAAIQALTVSQATLWLSSPFGDPYSAYVRLGPMPGGLSMGGSTGNVLSKTVLTPSVASAPNLTIACTYLQVARP